MSDATYTVGIRGMNYVIIDTRDGQVQKPAYITRTKAERACADMNEEAADTCAKCGMPITRDFSGWHHQLPPMSIAERRKYRHVVVRADA